MNRQQRRQAAKAARRGKQPPGVADAPVETQQAFQAAVTRYQAGDLAATRAALSGIDERAPGIPEVDYLFGLVLLQDGEPEASLPYLQRTIKTNRRDPAPCNVLGEAFRRLGRVDDSIAAYEEAIKRDARFADAHYNLGNVLRQAGRLKEAAARYERALDLEPDFADAHYNLGLALRALGRYDDAIAHYEKADMLAPGQADVKIGLSNALAMTLRYPEAEAAARAALSLDPNAMEAHNSLARVLQGLGRTAEARDAMDQAIARDPGRASLHANLGNILEDQDDAAGAEAAYRKAIALEPDFAEAHANLGLMLLLNRQVEEGWREYDWRWRRAGRPPRPFPQPRWQGEELADKTLFAWGDEGPGDEILFASLLPEVIAAAGSCVVECEPRLVPLFGRAFPDAEVQPRRESPQRRLLRDDIDLQTPFSEMARWLRPNLAEAPPPKAAYLQADPAVAEPCRARYRALGDGLVVGIAWASGNLLRPDRNAPLDLWDPILTLPGVQFVSLQYGDRTAEIAAVQERLGVDILVDPEIDQFASLERFAGQVDAVDIVVSITNTTVHMAGALGKTVWVMLPFMPDWRYQRDRTDSLWYPEMRLYRQTAARRWDDVIERVAGDLAAFRDGC